MLSLRSSPRGTTIIEAMAAMLVFTVGILGVMQMNVLASGQNTLALHQTTANRIARDLADAFERLPYDHPAFVPSGLTVDDIANDKIGDGEGFDDIEEGPGLINLQQDIMAPAGIRPLLSAADAVQTAEGLSPADDKPFYQVAWRSLRVPNTGSVESERGKLDSLRILIMVRFPTSSGFRQVNFWTIKYNPELVCAGTCTALEI